MDQLKCTQCFAKAVMLEINVVCVTSQLQCSRAWAIKLLGDYDWDLFIVLRKETDLNVQEQAHVYDHTW